MTSPPAVPCLCDWADPDADGEVTSTTEPPQPHDDCLIHGIARPLTGEDLVAVFGSGGGMKLYLAGPMSGYPEHNIPAFLATAAELRAMGFEVASPCEGLDQEERTWEEWMVRDIRMALDCEAVAVLPGWERSRGASLEVHIAQSLSRPIYSAAKLLEVFRPGGWALLHWKLSDALEAPRTPLFVPGRVPMEATIAEVNEWQAATFPSGTAQSAALHLLREAKELAENPTDPEEMADILMLVAAVAHRAGVDLHAALRAKLEKNRRREWGEPDADGVVEHVRSGEAA